MAGKGSRVIAAFFDRILGVDSTRVNIYSLNDDYWTVYVVEGEVYVCTRALKYQKVNEFMIFMNIYIRS